MNFSKETLFRRFNIKSVQIAERAFGQMTSGEKAVFFFFVFVLILSVLLMVGKINSYVTIERPSGGGEIKEGVIGFPRFVNPLLATSDADRDLVALVYSGLMKAAEDGNFAYDLAESYSVSDDGLEYTFRIKPDARFHDGAQVTADDIIFTVNKTKDSILKSLKRANWEGVSVEKINELEIKFTLKERYVPFIENTTIGILPKHIWGNIDSEQFAFSSFNTTPIGSGPYTVANVKRNSSGIPEMYSLRRFDEYALGTPYITKVEMHFFSNEESLIEALRGGRVTSVNGISSNVAKELTSSDYRVEQRSLPRIFGVFFNQSQAPIFTDRAVREALSVAVDREAIVREVLAGYGTKITSPIPGHALNQDIVASDDKSSDDTQLAFQNIERAKKILDEAGWVMDEKSGIRVKKTKSGTSELIFTIATSNAVELKRVGEIVRSSWEAIGARVVLELYEIGTLNQEVIRPRKYDALLFGEIIGRDLDLFAFWHSSQRNDPGLNIALYANIKADRLLEEIRTTEDKGDRRESFREFDAEIQRDIPAVFLYSPNFIYIIPKNIKGFSIGTITTPAERFLGIQSWYINTERVWGL